MSELNEDYVSDLRKGMVEAIFTVSEARQGPSVPGEARKLYIGAAEVSQALTILLAEFLEGVPGLERPADIRHMTETVARKLRLGIAEIRRSREETGGQPPPSLVIRGN